MKPVRLFSMILMLLAGGCSSAETSLDGEVIYVNNCSSCHAADLSGGRGAPLDAGSEAAAKSDTEYFAAIRSGPKIMPTFGSLSDQQVNAVIAYIRELQGR